MGLRRSKSEEYREFLRAGRQLLLRDPAAIYHALECKECGLRPQALLSLALVCWTESDYITAEMEASAGVRPFR